MLFMIQIQEETFINSSSSSIFNFLVHLDLYYKIWHPKDHVFCKVIFGSLDKNECIFHFLEILGGFPLYLIVKVYELKKDKYMAYRPIFPFSLLKIGRGYFRIENISSNKSRLIAFVEYGYGNSKWIDNAINYFVKTEVVKKHIKEEGENIKNFLEEEKL